MVGFVRVIHYAGDYLSSSHNALYLMIVMGIVKI